MFALSMVVACDVPVPEAPAQVESASAASTEPEVQANEGLLPEPDASPADVCRDNGLLLTRHDLTTLRNRFASVCCEGPLPADDPRCSAPWPGPEDMPCSVWSELQAQMLARHGHVFADAKVQAHYEAQPWYTPDGSFSVNNMSIQAKRNLLALKHFQAEQEHCKP